MGSIYLSMSFTYICKIILSEVDIITFFPFFFFLQILFSQILYINAHANTFFFFSIKIRNFFFSHDVNYKTSTQQNAGTRE